MGSRVSPYRLRGGSRNHFIKHLASLGLSLSDSPAAGLLLMGTAGERWVAETRCLVVKSY